MKHLNKYKTFEGLNPLHNNNERYYTLLDILQEPLDEISIPGIPDIFHPEDTESHLAANSYACWGFYKEFPILKGNSNKPDFEIDGIAIWNLTPSNFDKLYELIESEQPRIKDALGEHIKVKRDLIDDYAQDMYITLVPEHEYNRHKLSERVESAQTKLKYLQDELGAANPFRSLPKEDTEKVFNLIDEIYKIVNKK